jgi:hypothetical protein
LHDVGHPKGSIVKAPTRRAAGRQPTTRVDNANTSGSCVAYPPTSGAAN